MEPEQIAAIAKSQADAKAFRETILGSLFTTFENAHARAWQTDSRETASTAAMKRDWDRSDTARAEFVRVLKEAQKALEFYANPEIYKAHPHGLAFDDRDLSFCARAFFDTATPGHEDHVKMGM